MEKLFIYLNSIPRWIYAILLVALLFHLSLFTVNPELSKKQEQPSEKPSTTKDKEPEIPNWQVITLAQGERVYYKAGKVEKIEVDGIIANPSMPLEFIACTDGGKDYETLIVIKCKPWNIHLSLIMAGLKEGKGPKSFGDPTKPTGDLVLLFISWENNNKTITYRVEDLLIDSSTGKVLEPVGWSFSGSELVDDIDYDTGKPTGRKIYLADLYKNVVASWHDPAAILNIPTRGNLFLPNKQLLPPRGTKIVMTIRPPDAKELEELKKINAQVAEREAKEDKEYEQQKSQQETK